MAKIDRKEASINVKEIAAVMSQVEKHSGELEKIIFELADKATKDLDEIREKYEDWLLDNPTDAELEEMSLEISTKIYYAGEALERLGLNEDISKGIKADVYNNAYNDPENEGTIADKKAWAENRSTKETLTYQIYGRAYKMVKYKLEKMEESLNVIKKIIGKRGDMAAAGVYVYDNKKRTAAGSYKRFAKKKR